MNRSLWRPLGASVVPPLLCVFFLFQTSGEARDLRSAVALAIDAVALLVSFAVSIAAHEAGHALAARAVGLVVPAVQLGGGPAVWRRMVGATELKWTPLFGPRGRVAKVGPAPVHLFVTCI